MYDGFIRGTCNLFLLKSEDDKVFHIQKNIRPDLKFVGWNQSANMNKYELKGADILVYGDENTQHNGPLVVLQSAEESVQQEWLAELSQFPAVVNTIVSRDGHPVKVFVIPGYEIMCFYGDQNQPLRHTIRITRQPLEASDKDIAFDFYIAGSKLSKNNFDIISLNIAMQEFNAGVYYNPFASGGRFRFGSLLLTLATSGRSINPDQKMLGHAIIEFKISRDLGYNELEEINNALNICQHFYK